jgi:hypothetical protein
MEGLDERLALVGRHIERAIAAIEVDVKASPVLKAVVLEFQRKFQKASGAVGRESVVELEQAADSANVAAKADPGASEATRKAVDLAHTSICLLKAEPTSRPG